MIGAMIPAHLSNTCSRELSTIQTVDRQKRKEQLRPGGLLVSAGGLRAVLSHCAPQWALLSGEGSCC